MRATVANPNMSFCIFRVLQMSIVALVICWTAIAMASSEVETAQIKAAEAGDNQKARDAQAEQGRERALQAAATGKVVDEYKFLIAAKIRRNIVMPPDVQDSFQAEFDVTLMPSGSVLSVNLTKSSGSRAYDSAVMRAILQAQPLPLPQGVALFDLFKLLHLTFKESAQHTQQPEQGSQTPVNSMQESIQGAQEISRQPQEANEHANGDYLVQRSLEIARLEAEILKNQNANQKGPRRKFIGARTQEFRFAQYAENWRIKLERIGNMNYPEEARQNKIYGKVMLTVSIRADGSVENIEVIRSSGQRVLDEAALRIVKFASPFDPFPEDIRRDTDILSITRTWTFAHTDKLEGNIGVVVNTSIPISDNPAQTKP